MSRPAIVALALVLLAAGCGGRREGAPLVPAGCAEQVTVYGADGQTAHREVSFFDERGRVKHRRVFDPEGHVTSDTGWAFDQAGRTAQEWTIERDTTARRHLAWSHDEVGRPVYLRVDQGKEEWWWQYDERGRLVRRVTHFTHGGDRGDRSVWLDLRACWEGDRLVLVEGLRDGHVTLRRTLRHVHQEPHLVEVTSHGQEVWNEYRRRYYFAGERLVRAEGESLGRAVDVEVGCKSAGEIETWLTRDAQGRPVRRDERTRQAFPPLQTYTTLQWEGDRLRHVERRMVLDDQLLRAWALTGACEPARPPDEQARPWLDPPCEAIVTVADLERSMLEQDAWSGAF